MPTIENNPFKSNTPPSSPSVSKSGSMPGRKIQSLENDAKVKEAALAAQGKTSPKAEPRMGGLFKKLSNVLRRSKDEEIPKVPSQDKVIEEFNLVMGEMGITDNLRKELNETLKDPTARENFYNFVTTFKEQKAEMIKRLADGVPIGSDLIEKLAVVFNKYREQIQDNPNDSEAFLKTSYVDVFFNGNVLPRLQPDNYQSITDSIRLIIDPKSETKEELRRRGAINETQENKKSMSPEEQKLVDHGYYRQGIKWYKFHSDGDPQFTKNVENDRHIVTKATVTLGRAIPGVDIRETKFNLDVSSLLDLNTATFEQADALYTFLKNYLEYMEPKRSESKWRDSLENLEKILGKDRSEILKVVDKIWSDSRTQATKLEVAVGQPEIQFSDVTDLTLVIQTVDRTETFLSTKEVEGEPVQSVLTLVLQDPGLLSAYQAFLVSCSMAKQLNVSAEKSDKKDEHNVSVTHDAENLLAQLANLKQPLDPKLSTAFMSLIGAMMDKSFSPKV